MGFKQQLSKATGIPVSQLPTGYQIIGHVLLIKLPNIKSTEKKLKIAETVLTLVPNVKTVCEIKEVRGEYREPVLEKIAGNGTITTHKENDILYKIDAARIMFSKGNLAERKRLLDQVAENENIVDMFAGIGYFSLGLAKYTKAREILAIEKNPEAYNFLTDNIMLNKLNNINAIQGDCAQAAMSFKGYADRVIMGYFPNTEQFLQHAMHMSRNGCTIHYHNIYKIKDLWKKPMKEIEEAARERNVKIDIIKKKKVKSYAPNVFHVVVDFRVTK